MTGRLTYALRSPIASYETTLTAPYTGWKDRCTALFQAVKYAGLGAVGGGLWGGFLGGTPAKVAQYCIASLPASSLWSQGCLGSTLGGGVFLVTGRALQTWVVHALSQKETASLVYGWSVLSIAGSFTAGALGATGCPPDLLLLVGTALGTVVGTSFGAIAGKNWYTSHKADIAFGRAVIGHVSLDLLPDSLSEPERKERIFRIVVELMIRHSSPLTEENLPGCLGCFREQLETLRSQFQRLDGTSFPLGFSFREPVPRTKNRQFILEVRAVQTDLIDNLHAQEALRQILHNGVRSIVTPVRD